MMRPKTKAHTLSEIEQEMTIEPLVKRFFGMLVTRVAIVLTSLVADE